MGRKAASSTNNAVEPESYERSRCAGWSASRLVLHSRRRRIWLPAGRLDQERAEIAPPLGATFAKPTLMSLTQCGIRPQRSRSKLRSPALRSSLTTGSRSVGAAFQLGGKLGAGPCGGIEKTSLISSHRRRGEHGHTFRKHSGHGAEIAARAQAPALRRASTKPAKPEPNRDFERTPPSAVRAIFG